MNWAYNISVLEADTEPVIIARLGRYEWMSVAWVRGWGLVPVYNECAVIRGGGQSSHTPVCVKVQNRVGCQSRKFAFIMFGALVAVRRWVFEQRIREHS